MRRDASRFFVAKATSFFISSSLTFGKQVRQFSRCWSDPEVMHRSPRNSERNGVICWTPSPLFNVPIGRRYELTVAVSIGCEDVP